jgi:hypothetical protein
MNGSLLDAGDHELETKLLDAGREVELSSAAQARILTTLGIAAGGVAIAGKAAAGSSLLGKLSSMAAGHVGWATVAGVVSVGALGAGAAYVGGGGSQATSNAAVVPPVANQAVPQVRTTSENPAEPASVDAEALAPTPAEEDQETTSAARSPKPSVGRTPATVTLGDEVALVESASRALRSGNAAAALGRLAEYRRRFPRGKMALEAQVLRIEALARAGRVGEAETRASAFLKRYPNSPVAARIRRYAE